MKRSECKRQLPEKEWNDYRSRTKNGKQRKTKGTKENKNMEEAVKEGKRMKTTITREEAGVVIAGIE